MSMPQWDPCMICYMVSHNLCQSFVVMHVVFIFLCVKRNACSGCMCSKLYVLLGCLLLTLNLIFDQNDHSIQAVWFLQSVAMFWKVLTYPQKNYIFIPS